MLQRLFFCLSVTSRLGIRHKKGKQPRRTLQAPSAAGSPPPPSPVPPEPSCEEDAPSPRPPRSVREQVRALPSHRSGAQVCTEKRRRGELSAAGKRAVCGPRALGVRPIGPAGPPVYSARLSHFSKEDRRSQVPPGAHSAVSVSTCVSPLTVRLSGLFADSRSKGVRFRLTPGTWTAGSLLRRRLVARTAGRAPGPLAPSGAGPSQ